MARIEIDPGAGFCFGVEEVVKSAEEVLQQGQKLYGLGAMVHNSREVERLAALGLETIDHQDLGRLEGARVLFRAHGEPPSTYALAARQNLDVMDGTCPIVLKLQERIRKAHASMDHEKEQLVIFGKSEHPETIGLLGQVEGDALVISSADEAAALEGEKKIILFSQTTMDPDQYEEVEKVLGQRMARTKEGKLRSHCGICGQMKNRKPGLKRFAEMQDLVIFVSGKRSSNGKMLSEFCREINPRTHCISDPGELETAWFREAEHIGISGATSTSMEQLETVKNEIEKFISS